MTLTAANPAGVSVGLGDVISLTTSKLGYSGGRLMTVTSVRVDYQRNLIDLTCWG